MRERNGNPDPDSLKRFDRQFFKGTDRFTYIGSGELGGKAHGLSRMTGVLGSSLGDAFEPDISVVIPRLTVITTEFFDLFMKQNDLASFADGEERDDLIAHAFLKGDLPVQLLGDLRALVGQVHSPLAVRSSSMLEDAMFEPFANVYATKMVPNNQPDTDSRFHKLVEAIKFVYASTFFKTARNYMEATSHTTRDEKMAVIIQEVVGDRFGDRFYPHISGVLRSYNFYPTGHASPEDGIVELALGLGRTIVDDGVSWSFSPAFPQAAPPFKSMSDLLKGSQTSFWAINMGKQPRYDPIKETEYMSKFDLGDAEYDGTLPFIASTYDQQDDRITIGLDGYGPRVIDFAPILQVGIMPLNDLLLRLKETCEESLGAMVEIEFAARLGRERCTPAEFGFLQVRPTVVSQAEVDLRPEDLSGDGVLLASEKVLGNGTLDTILDIVYLVPERFDLMKTSLVAEELEKLNRTLLERGRHYLLIGFGRWGTTDPLGGIPVDFGQISGAKVIVEASLPDYHFMMSQGSHFFHNMTSFKIFYFSVDQDAGGRIDWMWLSRRRTGTELRFIRHVELDRPLVVKVDGRNGRGVIRHD